MTLTFDDAYTQMAAITQEWSRLSKDGSTQDWTPLDNLVQKLGVQGWTRKQMYTLVVNIQHDKTLGLSEDALNALYDFESSLTGRCHVDCILRLPAESDLGENFLNYVRGMKWLGD